MLRFLVMAWPLLIATVLTAGGFLLCGWKSAAREVAAAIGGVVAVAAGVYWVLSAPPPACAAIAASQRWCAALAKAHNLALAAGIAALVVTIMCLVTASRRRAG
jgi:hypothetical protein